MGKVNTYIHGESRYRVVAACAVVKRMEGGQVYLERNARLPIDSRPDHVTYLLSIGAIEAVSA